MSMNKEQFEEQVRKIQQSSEERLIGGADTPAGETGTGVSLPPGEGVSPPPDEDGGEVVTLEQMVENAAPFHKDVFNAGINQAHEKIESLRQKYRTSFDEKVEAAEEAKIKADIEKFGEFAAKAMAQQRTQQEALNHFQLPAPVWQQHTGLFPHLEKHMNPNDRAARINKLLRIVERMVKYEMRQNCRRDAGDTAGKMPVVQNDSVIRQTHLWDPLRSVCFRLEISQAQLSRYAKEITGMSATEIVDCLRMERARKQMKEDLRKFIAQIKAEDAGCSGADESNSKEHRKQPRCFLAPTDNPKSEDIWAALKASRHAPRWHRSSWAAQFGFSSYGKFFRACILVFGATPHEIEIALIDEILADGEQNRDREGAENQNHDRNGAPEADSAVEEVVKRE